MVVHFLLILIWLTPNPFANKTIASILTTSIIIIVTTSYESS